MGGVSLLPQEFGCAEEWAGAHLPSHDVAPLVAHQWQVAPRVNPVAVGVPYNSLRRGADDEFLLKLCRGVNLHTALVVLGAQAIMGHHGALLGEAFHMLGFLGEERLRDKQWEVGILRASLLEHQVELVLHLLPDGITIGFDHHTSAYCRLLGEVGLHYQIIKPLTIVVSPLCKFF